MKLEQFFKDLNRHFEDWLNNDYRGATSPGMTLYGEFWDAKGKGIFSEWLAAGGDHFTAERVKFIALNYAQQAIVSKSNSGQDFDKFIKTFTTLWPTYTFTADEVRHIAIEFMNTGRPGYVWPTHAGLYDAFAASDKGKKLLKGKWPGNEVQQKPESDCKAAARERWFNTPEDPIKKLLKEINASTKQIQAVLADAILQKMGSEGIRKVDNSWIEEAGTIQPNSFAALTGKKSIDPLDAIRLVLDNIQDRITDIYGTLAPKAPAQDNEEEDDIYDACRKGRDAQKTYFKGCTFMVTLKSKKHEHTVSCFVNKGTTEDGFNKWVERKRDDFEAVYGSCFITFATILPAG